MNELSCFVLLHRKQFYFDGKIFNQFDKGAMGSPLGTALVNLFIDSNEQNSLESDHGRFATSYRRCVGEFFFLFPNEH